MSELQLRQLVAVLVLLLSTPQSTHQSTCHLERECAEEFEECFRSLRTIDTVHHLLPTAAWDVQLMCRRHEVDVQCPPLWSSACASFAQVDVAGTRVPANWTVEEFQRGFCNGNTRNDYAVDVLCYTTTRKRSKTLNCRTKLRGDESKEKHPYTFQLEYCKGDNVNYRQCLLKAAQRSCPGKPRRFIVNILPVVFDFQCPLCTRHAISRGAMNENWLMSLSASILALLVVH